MAALHRELWMRRSPGERLDFLLGATETFIGARMGMLRKEHPDASEAELTAIWTEERYRDSLDPEFLARACAAIRARDDG